VPKISFLGMIRPLLGGWGGIAIRLKKIYIPRAIFEFLNPPWDIIFFKSVIEENLNQQTCL